MAKLKKLYYKKKNFKNVGYMDNSELIGKIDNNKKNHTKNNNGNIRKKNNFTNSNLKEINNLLFNFKNYFTIFTSKNSGCRLVLKFSFFYFKWIVLYDLVL